MSDFNSPKNPLPDLMPLEEDRSVELSSEQLGAIRASLMETSWRTKEIVNVLERNNIFLERDLEKITNLKRRFRRSIGIIPGMPGKAGALFGAGVGMGLILPFGFKWPESPDIPPIGKPQPPLTPVPDPVFVPVDVPQPIPVDVPEPIPVDVPEPIPVDVPVNVPGGVPGDITDIIPDVTGGIKDPLKDIIDGVTGGVTDVIGDPGPTDIPIIPVPGKDVEIPDTGGELINPGALPTGAYAWVDNLNPQQVWEILKANLGKPIVWKILAVAGVSAALLFIPFDGQALSVLGSIKVLSMLKYAIGAGLLIIPATIAPASATETSNLNNSNLNINNSIGDFSTSSSDIASLQLNTRKTDTFVIITDQPIA